MTRPTRYLIRMVLFLLAVGALTAPLFQPLREAFMANAPLNGGILAVLILGIIYNLVLVMRLNPEVEWVESYRRDGPQLSAPSQPRLLGPMSTMLGEKKSRLTLSTTSLRTLLDGLLSRLEESRDISRYTIGLLIFLGLLGTFWGLLETVASAKDVIVNLSVDSGDANAMFTALKKGLEGPLSGMGTAFSSSLFGLSGSLILGFLDLQAGQALNRFYNDLEEWLSSLTRLSSGALSGDGDQSVPAYVQALLEQSAESLENLQRIMSRSEESRIGANQQIAQLAEKLDRLTDLLAQQGGLMQRLAQSGDQSLDADTRASIRNLDRSLTRVAEDLTSGRDEIIKEVRSEIKLLARTIANIAEGEYDR